MNLNLNLKLRLKLADLTRRFLNSDMIGFISDFDPVTGLYRVTDEIHPEIETGWCIAARHAQIDSVNEIGTKVLVRFPKGNDTGGIIVAVLEQVNDSVLENRLQALEAVMHSH